MPNFYPYPSVSDLWRIERWPITDIAGCLVFVRREWQVTGQHSITDISDNMARGVVPSTAADRLVVLRTAGSAGNELLLKALNGNAPIWQAIWRASIWPDITVLAVPRQEPHAKRLAVGFTGTRNGMTPGQLKAFSEHVAAAEASEFHHGDCRGADAQAHDVVRRLGVPIHIHPSLPRNRAFCAGWSVMHDVKGYLERNHDIVDACDVLYAAPETAHETLRSGTWATVRYARKQQKPILIF